MYVKALAMLAAGLLLATAAAAAERQQRIAAAKPAPGGERRLALVVGNGAYRSSPLRNPVRDARAVARALSETGFNVTLVEDATQSGLRTAIREFGDSLLGGGVGLFYYAGHGMQVRGRNYLIPVNADIQREDEVADQAVDADLVLAKMETARNGLNLVVLDACRNNPFARSFRSSSQGLAQMDAPSGTLIAFATAPGQVASDGEGDNGLYTRHLVSAMQQPGLAVEQLFKQVRVAVTQETGDRQIPWESSSLKGDFYFLPAAASSAEQLDRKRVEEMIQAALARQAKERVVPPPPAPSAPVVAAFAPQPPAPLPGLPAAGAQWTYRSVTGSRPAREYTVRLQSANEAEIFDLTRGGHAAAVESVHAKGPYLTGAAGSGGMDFSPYIGLFQSLQVGQSWADVDIRQVDPCSNPSYRCTAKARVTARENVAVAAGTFAAYRIEVELSALSLMNAVTASVRSGTARLTCWYSDDVKRVVKAQLRGDNHIVDRIDVELVSYGGLPRVAQTQVAAVAAPPPAGAAPPGLPRAGSRWSYRLQDLYDSSRRTDYTVELQGATDAEILDTTRRLRAAASEWVHAKGGYLVGVPGSSIIEFAPYVGLFEALQPGSSWSQIDIRQIYPCTDPAFRCTGQARISARENVTVPAGSFSAYRIEVELIALAMSTNPNASARTGTARFVFWYADEPRRIVKYQSRGDRHIVDHVDAQLLSYKLN